MHNYIVPNRYKYQTRVGNWSEEWDLEDAKMKDYVKSKTGGQLASTVRDQKQGFSLRAASLSVPAQDGYLRFGSHFMLLNHKTQGVLACDIQEKLKLEEEAYAVSTTTFVKHPSVRSVFVFQRYENDFYQDDLIHYGQKVRIVANPRLFSKKQFFLHSLPMTPARCAKISRWQEVCISSLDVYNTVWILKHADPKIRFEMDGQPVGVNEPVIVEHSFTSQWLASDDIVYQNDFGKEKEVFCHSFQCLNKTQNLIAEKQGRTTIDIPLRNQEKQNLWSIVLAQDPSQNFNEEIIDDTKSVSNILARFKQQVLGKGVYGVRGLAKLFQEMDINKNHVLEYDDFKWGLRTYGIQATDEEVKTVFTSLDRNKNGVLDFNEFLAVFRSYPNDFRLGLIEAAYGNVQKKFGRVTLDALGRAINVSKHPEVLRGYKTEREVFRDFVNNWNKQTPDREIALEEFFEYYSDISSSIDRDEHFEALIRNLWGL